MNDTKSNRALKCATNWKIREINKLNDIKQHMLKMNEFDKEYIDKYINLEYDKIIDKYNQKINKNNKNDENDKINKEKKKAISNLIESSIFLESSNIDPNYIKKKSNEKFNKINTLFDEKKKNTQIIQII
jgi:ABC-type lipoprotein release transport system permease subunit